MGGRAGSGPAEDTTPCGRSVRRAADPRIVHFGVSDYCSFKRARMPVTEFSRQGESP